MGLSDRIISAAPKELGNLDLLVLGAVSKILSTVCTYPLQTIKTNLSKHPSAGAGPAKDVLQIVGQIMANHGILGFLSGPAQQATSDGPHRCIHVSVQGAPHTRPDEFS